MSDYRYQITEHNGVQCLHIIMEHAPDDLEGMSHTYIPVIDIQETFAKRGVQNTQLQQFAQSILRVAQIANTEIERLNTANPLPENAVSLFLNAIETCFNSIINACNAQLPMRIEMSDEQREALKAKLKEMDS